MEEVVCPLCKTAMVSVRDLELFSKAAKWKKVICHCICGEVRPIAASQEDLREVSPGSPGRFRQKEYTPAESGISLAISRQRKGRDEWN
jgi:hypothetical protein